MSQVSMGAEASRWIQRATSSFVSLSETSVVSQVPLPNYPLDFWGPIRPLNEDGARHRVTEREEFVEISLFESIYRTISYLQIQGIHVNPNEVEDYFLKFPDMIETTRDVAFIVIQKLPAAKLFLKVYRDPEIEDTHLVIYARFQSYDEDTMKKIKATREEYRGRLIGKRGWLLLTTDFEPIG